MPFAGVLDRDAAPGRDAEPPGCLEVDVGARLAACDLLRGDGGREAVGDACSVEHGVDQRSVRGRRDGERERRRQVADGVDGSVDERQVDVR